MKDHASLQGEKIINNWLVKLGKYGGVFKIVSSQELLGQKIPNFYRRSILKISVCSHIDYWDISENSILDLFNRPKYTICQNSKYVCISCDLARSTPHKIKLRYFYIAEIQYKLLINSPLENSCSLNLIYMSHFTILSTNDSRGKCWI